MNNPFIQRQMELRQRIISGFLSGDEVQKGEDDLELEKAHKDGDIHPNGKWVWVSSANGGKGDWRTAGGRTHQKHTATATQGGSGASGNQVPSGGSNGTPKAEKPGQQASITDTEKKQLKEIVDKGFKISKISWNDVSKMSLEKTPRGNWRCYYDGKDTGNIISGKLMSEATANKLGLLKGGMKKVAGNNNAGGSKSAPSAVPTTVEDALKHAQVDTDKIKSEAKKVSLAYGKDDIDQAEEDVRWYEKRLKDALSDGDPNKIKNAADSLASKELYLDEYKKNLTAKKKERKQFIDSAGHDFTEDQVQEYLDNYKTDKTHRAVVRNTWSYSMGRIGSTSATIEVGQGKAKKFDRYSSPSWRPIGMIEYSVRNWGSGYSKVKVPVQSWSEIENNLSDTENFTLYLYKHPKQ